MALVIADRVRETTTTAGTGSVTLAGAVTGFQSFSVIGDTNTCYYCISDQSGSNWEVGIGTYSTTGPTLARTTVLASSNAGSLVSFGSNTKDVFVTQPAERAVYTQATGNRIEIHNPVVPLNDGWGVIECVDDGLGDDFNDLNIYLLDQYANKLAPFFSGGIASADFVIRSQDWTTNYHFVRLYVPSGMAGDYTLTLPSSPGSANQVLKTDGTGNLSWLDFGSPPAIGGTAPAAGTFTTLSATSVANTSSIARAGGKTSVLSILNQATYTSGGVTLASQTAANNATWRIRAFGTFTAANNATARTAQVAVFWGSTQLVAITPSVLISTAQTTSWQLEFTITGSSTTAVWTAGTLLNRIASATALAVDNATAASTTVTSGAQTIDLRFRVSTAVASEGWNVQSVTIERLV